MSDANSVPARGTGGFAFRIEEVFDKRLGQTVFEVYAKNPDTGASWLIAECNTRASAREVIHRRREVSDGQ